LTMLVASISFFMVFCEYFIYKDFSFYTLLTVIIEAGVFILTYIYMLKEKLINKTNSKKTNVINLVIVILLLEYIVGIVDLLLGLIFKVNEMADIVNNLIIYAVGTCIVLIAYKLFNNTKTKISNKVEPTIKEEVKKISKPKKKVKVVSTEKKSTIPKKKVSTSKTKKTTSKKETK
ncbi:MAG TPA: hypothetical protein PLX66_03505, partial [Bacilli bacterium]|nr:hypothetical protein [Bacilli bacterium]